MIVKRPLCVLSFVFFSKIAIPRYNKSFAKFQLCLKIFCQLHTEYPSRGHEFTSGFSGVRVALSLVFCVMFCRSLFVLFSCGHCIVCPSSIYGFWLPLWYLQNFLSILENKKWPVMFVFLHTCTSDEFLQSSKLPNYLLSK